MSNWLFSLFDTSGFVPRWECGTWTAAHGWLHILADLGVWSAYVAIPCVLGYFLARRKDLPFRSVFVLFCGFILACGTTHLMEAIIFWVPLYRLAGWIKVATAIISWGTVLALVPIAPKVLAMRSPEMLEAEIRERLRVEESLRVSEERYRLLVEATTDCALFMLDPEGRVASWNAGARRVTGYEEPEVLERSWSCFYTDDEARRGDPAQALQTARATGRHQDEGWRLRKDGSRYWANVIVTALRDASGHLKGFAQMTRDLTERKQAELALEESRRFVERVTEAIPNIIYVYDLQEERNFFVNHRIESILGYSAKNQAVSVPALFRDHVHSDDRPVIERSRDQFLAAADGAIVEAEFRVRHANGEWRWLHRRDTVFVRDADGCPTQVLGIAQDITERKRLEQEVLEVATQEQRWIGQELHESTGQELTGLSMLAENLADALRDNAPAEARMAQRIAEGVRHTLGQVRAQSRGLVPVEVDAEGLMAALTELSQRMSELHGVHCAFTCVAPVPVEDNLIATQLFRIAQEAITNALKHGHARNICVGLEARGSYITLRISDDGVGFPHDDQSQDGMGLRIMRYRAGQVGAQLTICPGASCGTLVTCTLYRETRA